MSADSPMKRLWEWRVRKNRWGVEVPTLALYWASRRRFLYPGLHVWAFNRQWRVLPLPRKEQS